eukprot:3988734-Amphidinium_carterae.1
MEGAELRETATTLRIGPGKEVRHDESDEKIESSGEGILAAGELRCVVVEGCRGVIDAVRDLLVRAGASA